MRFLVTIGLGAALIAEAIDVRVVRQHIGGVVFFNARVGALRVGGPHAHRGVVQRAHLVGHHAHERLGGLDAAKGQRREQAGQQQPHGISGRALESDD